jgi:hypothetical protein
MTLGVVVASIASLAIGAALLVRGLRTRNRAEKFLAPLGALGVSSGLRYLLIDALGPNRVLLSLGGIVFVGVVYWMVRVSRQDNGRDVESR